MPVKLGQADIVKLGQANLLVKCMGMGNPLSCTKHVWYSEHGTYHQFKIILEQAMSATHVAVIPHMRIHSDEEEFPKK